MSNRDIIVENLVKRYKGGVTAVDGVSLAVKSGQTLRDALAPAPV